MAISSIELYEDLQFLLNKNNSEYISPEEFERICAIASEDLFRDYLGDRNVRRSVYGNNSITDARLNVFKVTTPPIVYNPTVRTVPVPSDCRHIRSVTDESGNVIKYQDDNRFYMLSKDSTVDLERDAFYKEEMKYLEIATKRNMAQVIIQYLKKPDAPKLPYDFVDREIVFRTSEVVDLEWDTQEKSNLLNRLLILSGITIRDTMVTQIGRINKSEE